MASSRKSLSGRRIAALVADGFEQIELTVPVKALRAEGATVDVLSLHGGKVIGMNLDQPGKRVRVDRTLTDAAADEYDGVFVPGGLIGPDLLRQSHEARAFVRAFDEANRPIAALCHGPWLLISAGLARGRRMASWPGIRDDVVNAGAIWCDQPAVRDGNWVTSRSPEDFEAFTAEMIRLFAPDTASAPRATEPSSSSPQHRRPPGFLAQGMVWLPRLARAKTALATLGTIAVGGLAVLLARRAFA